MTHQELPLFSHQPPCRFIVFPPERRVGKIRDVAQKWLSQRTEKLANKYALQINADLNKKFDSLGILPAERERLTGEFWRAVKVEIGRLRYASDDSSRPGGAA